MHVWERPHCSIESVVNADIGGQVNDPANPTKKLDDYWTPSQALLGDTTFMSQLQEYDK